MSLLSRLPAAFSAALLSEGGEHAERFLKIPVWIWQILNLGLFLAVLLYFVAKPMAEAFRKRQDEIEKRRAEAEKQRAHVRRLASELAERAARVEREIEEIRKQGRADGEQARRALTERANEEAERIRRDAGEEIERRLAAAKAQLRQTAAELTGAAATEILSREITLEDRQRILSESIVRMREVR